MSFWLLLGAALAVAGVVVVALPFLHEPRSTSSMPPSGNVWKRRRSATGPWPR